MPDKNGVLTQEEREKLLDFFHTRWSGGHDCPICKANDWNLAEYIIHSWIYRPDGLHTGGPAYPLVHFLCSNCGYTVLFNAVILGILPGAEDAEKKTDEEEKHG